MSNDQKLEVFINSLLSMNAGDSITLTNQDLNNINVLVQALEYRSPAKVTKYIRYPSSMSQGVLSFELCPKCNTVVERRYQSFCNNCGQKLKWISIKKMTQAETKKKNEPVINCKNFLVNERIRTAMKAFCFRDEDPI